MTLLLLSLGLAVATFLFALIVSMAADIYEEGWVAVNSSPMPTAILGMFLALIFALAHLYRHTFTIPGLL